MPRLSTTFRPYLGHILVLLFLGTTTNAWGQQAEWEERILGSWALTKTSVEKSEDVMFPSKYDIMPDYFLEELGRLSPKGEVFTFRPNGVLAFANATQNNGHWEIDERSRLVLTNGPLDRVVSWEFMDYKPGKMTIGLYLRGYDIGLSFEKQPD